MDAGLALDYRSWESLAGRWVVPWGCHEGPVAQSFVAAARKARQPDVPRFVLRKRSLGRVYRRV